MLMLPHSNRGPEPKGFGAVGTLKTLPAESPDVLPQSSPHLRRFPKNVRGDFTPTEPRRHSHTACWRLVGCFENSQ